MKRSNLFALYIGVALLSSVTIILLCFVLSHFIGSVFAQTEPLPIQTEQWFRVRASTNFHAGWMRLTSPNMTFERSLWWNVEMYTPGRTILLRTNAVMSRDEVRRWMLPDNPEPALRFLKTNILSKIQLAEEEE